MVSADFSVGPADEYDSYLMVAFGMAQSGRSEEDIVAYLADIASNHMGLGLSQSDYLAEKQTAAELVILAKSLT